jgi:hypothetical protein
MQPNEIVEEDEPMEEQELPAPVEVSDKGSEGDSDCGDAKPDYSKVKLATK